MNSNARIERLEDALLSILKEAFGTFQFETEIAVMKGLAADPDPNAWTDWETTKTEPGTWFLWRDDNAPHRVHADRADPGPDGMIDMKYGCGLSYSGLCQPALFTARVVAKLRQISADFDEAVA